MPWGPRFSPGVQYDWAPRGAGERSEQPRREGGPTQPHAVPGPTRLPSRGNHASPTPQLARLPQQPSAPPVKPSSCPSLRGQEPRSPTLTTPGAERRAREPRAAAGGASAALTAAPAAGAHSRLRGGGRGVAPAGSPSPARHPGPPPGCRQVPPMDAGSLPAPSVAALPAGRA